MGEVENELWLRILRLEQLLSEKDAVEGEDPDCESTNVDRILRQTNTSFSESTKSVDVSAEQPLADRTRQAHEKWKALAMNKHGITAAIENILQSDPLCNEVLDAADARENGRTEGASSLYKLKCVTAANWDAVRQSCQALEEVLQLGDVLSSTHAVRALPNYCEQAQAALKAEQQRKEVADDLRLRVAAAWDEYRKRVDAATSLQVSWALLLSTWEKKVEAAMKKKGIAPVTEL